MKLIIGNSYVLVIDVCGKALTYTATIEGLDGNDVIFTDKYGKKMTYNQKYIVSSQEIDNDN